MITFYLFITAGLMKILAAFIVQRINKEDPDFINDTNKKRIKLIKAVDYFALIIAIIGILFAVLPSLRKLQ